MSLLSGPSHLSGHLRNDNTMFTFKLVPPVTSPTYARFVDLAHVNSLVGNWSLKPTLTLKSGKMIATLELYDNGAYSTESSCLEFLLDVIVSAEGIRWATKQGILA